MSVSTPGPAQGPGTAMAISVFDLFKVGIGPSSSHTVGPMNAARMSRPACATTACCPGWHGVRVALYGSLGLTGPGHGSDKAVLLGLEGESPPAWTSMRSRPGWRPSGKAGACSCWASTRSPSPCRGTWSSTGARARIHPNGMRFIACDADGAVIRQRDYYSVGGGFVAGETAAAQTAADQSATPQSATDGAGDAVRPDLPYPFSTATELLAHTTASGLPVSGVMLANEQALGRTAGQVRAGLDALWQVMRACVERGCRSDGMLPGGLKVPRRAPRLYRQLTCEPDGDDPLRAMDWVTLYALAVNEENAAGGRVVTAPTNGAAGIIPAVLHYYNRFVPGASPDGVARFLLTAAAIGALFKENASISGAEVGCQGEVGSACSMAAGALAEVLGGTPEQVENAAEIGIEHNLGLTCDPIGGLVQVPCIERNAVASVTAINAARIALRGDGRHFVSLDAAISTMRATGRDMLDKYKETSRGGLAVNVIEC